MFRKQIWFDCNQFYICKISLEMTARFSKNIFILRLVFTGQKLTVLIYVSKVIRSAKLTLFRNTLCMVREILKTYFINLAQAIRVYNTTGWGIKWPLFTLIFLFLLGIPRFVLLTENSIIDP